MDRRSLLPGILGIHRRPAVPTDLPVGLEGPVVVQVDLVSHQDVLGVGDCRSLDELDREPEPAVDRGNADDAVELVAHQVATAVESVESSSSPLEAEPESSADEHRSSLAVLAREDREAAVGDVFEEYGDRPGVEIRFTGPWPAYSFAPSLGDDQ